MQDYKLDKEEKQILRDYEADRYISVKNFRQTKKKLQQAAQFTLNKNRNINIRVSERDLFKIKAQAFERGLPYQTLVSSLLHQFSNGQIKELTR